MLLHRNRTHSREVLADLFWGDFTPEQARSCLSTAIWRLRRALEPEGILRGTYLICSHGGEIGFNIESPHWLDSAVLEEKALPALRHPSGELSAIDAQALEEALLLYRGDLLEGFYDNWAIREREHFRAIYLDCLSSLMHYARRAGIYEKGLAFGRAILMLEPLREEVHREMMALYATCGQRALALQQYENCCQILKTEMGLAPMEETRRVFQQISADGGAAPRPIRLDIPSQLSSLQAALEQLTQTVNLAAKMQEQLRHSIYFLEAGINSVSKEKKPRR